VLFSLSQNLNPDLASLMSMRVIGLAGWSCSGKTTPSELLTRECIYPSYWIPMSSGSQTNAPIFASSELLEALRERAYVRGGGDRFLITALVRLMIVHKPLQRKHFCEARFP
jgi:hypothetical protein